MAGIHRSRADASLANGHTRMVDAGLRDDDPCGWEYRWRWRDNANGKEFGFTREMLEVAVHSKIAHTQIYDTGDCDFGSMGGEPSIITVTFNETNGITHVVTSIKYASKADRDAAMSTGMTDGMEMNYKQLDAVLAS